MPLENSGTSFGEALAKQAERTRDPRRKAELLAQVERPPFPAPLRYLWRLFWRLRRRKAGNGYGPNPIEWPDIDAFVRNARLKLSPFEIETIEMLDDAFLAAQREKPDLDPLTETED